VSDHDLEIIISGEKTAKVYRLKNFPIYGNLLCFSSYSTGSQWYYVTPFAMRKMLNWIQNKYGDIPVYISETGISDNDGTLKDGHRVSYFKEYTNEVLKGMLNRSNKYYHRIRQGSFLHCLFL
jgi:hypothetical protein